MADSMVYRDEKKADKEKNIQDSVVTSTEVGTEGRGRINASGHVDGLDRQYGLLSICATALNIGECFLVSQSSLT
jgi:hypothetical protein